MQFKQITDSQEILRAITDAYREDPIVVEQFHPLAGEPFEKCVELDYNQCTDKYSKFFKVFIEKECVGCFCLAIKDGLFVSAFFYVSPKFRSKDVTLPIWEFMTGLLAGKDMFIGVAPDNAKAFKFYSRNSTYMGEFPHPSREGVRIRIFKTGGFESWQKLQQSQPSLPQSQP